MPTAGVADSAQSVGVTIEFGGMGFEPAGAIVYVLDLQRIWKPCANPLTDGGHNQACSGQWLTGGRVIGVVFVGPRPTVDA